MLKTVLLIGAAALSAPVLAQDQGQAAQTPMTTAPAQTKPAPTTPQAPATTTQAPAMNQTATDTTTSSTTQTATAETAPADAKPVTDKTQIAQVVDTEFPTYDKNADSNLNRSEFGAWMVALKTASDPATKATDAATVKWVDGAFASADADKSKSVSKAELTKYLSQGAG